MNHESEPAEVVGGMALVDEAPAQARKEAWLQSFRRFIGGPSGAVLGGLAFAVWAALVNRDAGSVQALRSGTGQFLTSAALTWGDARLMDWVFHRFKRPWLGAGTAVVGSLTMSYSLVIGVHYLLHTPHILLTLLPGVVPTLAYTFIYAGLLVHGRAPVRS